jgi:hypothetical protein
VAEIDNPKWKPQYRRQSDPGETDLEQAKRQMLMAPPRFVRTDTGEDLLDLNPGRERL